MDELIIALGEDDFRKLVATRMVEGKIARTRAVVDAMVGTMVGTMAGPASSSSVKAYEARVVVVLSDMGYEKMRDAIELAQIRGEGVLILPRAKESILRAIASLNQAILSSELSAEEVEAIKYFNNRLDDIQRIRR